MKTALFCLLLFAGWTVLLVAAVIGWRTIQVLTSKTPANGFKSGMEHGPDLYWRINRAHVNAVETLALFATIALTGAVIGLDSDGFATTAQVVVGARIVQTVAHVSSGRSLVVQIRFTAFVTQLAALVAMAAMVGQRLLAS